MLARLIIVDFLHDLRCPNWRQNRTAKVWWRKLSSSKKVGGDISITRHNGRLCQPHMAPIEMRHALRTRRDTVTRQRAGTITVPTSHSDFITRAMNGNGENTPETSGASAGPSGRASGGKRRADGPPDQEGRPAKKASSRVTRSCHQCRGKSGVRCSGFLPCSICSLVPVRAAARLGT